MPRFPYRGTSDGLGFKNFPDEEEDLYDFLVDGEAPGGPYFLPDYKELDDEYGVC